MMPSAKLPKASPPPSLENCSDNLQGSDPLQACCKPPFDSHLHCEVLSLLMTAAERVITARKWAIQQVGTEIVLSLILCYCLSLAR